MFEVESSDVRNSCRGNRQSLEPDKYLTKQSNIKVIHVPAMFLGSLQDSSFPGRKNLVQNIGTLPTFLGTTCCFNCISPVPDICDFSSVSNTKLVKKQQSLNCGQVLAAFQCENSRTL